MTAQPVTVTADAIIGENVHQLMWRSRLSQTELGALLGVAQPNVGKRLRGETSWTIDELLIVARHLGVTLEELLPGKDYDPVPKPARGRRSAAGGGTAFLPIERVARLERFELPTFCVGAGNVVAFPRRSRPAADVASAPIRPVRHLRVVRQDVAS